MADKAWKQRERDVADFFHGQRNPLSGRNSKHTAADVIHDRLFIECKLRKKHTVVSLWDEVKALADKEKGKGVLPTMAKLRGRKILARVLVFLKRPFRSGYSLGTGPK